MLLEIKQDMYRAALTPFFILFSFMVCGQHESSIAIDSNGARLRQFYLGRNVEHLWLKGHHVDWETGKPDRLDLEDSRLTHCNRFVTATCKRMGIYLPRLSGANAEYDWLASKKARKNGWVAIINENLFDEYFEAQQYANRGFVTIAVYQDQGSFRPGHIAFITPTGMNYEQIQATGPMLIQAGGINSDSIPFNQGFRKRIKSWPEKKILFYYSVDKPVY